MKTIRVPTALVIVLLAGCGKSNEQTYTTSDGTKMKVTPTGDGEGKMTITGADGQKATIDTTGGTYKTTSTDKDGKTSTFEMSAKPDLAAFEGLLYPNAKPATEAGSFSNMKTGEMTLTIGAFTTTDKPETVLEHYKKALPGADTATFGTMSTVGGKSPKGADVSVTINAGENGGPTAIHVTVTKKA